MGQLGQRGGEQGSDWGSGELQVEVIESDGLEEKRRLGVPEAEGEAEFAGW